jgi:hypothetical protein
MGIPAGDPLETQLARHLKSFLKLIACKQAPSGIL